LIFKVMTLFPDFFDGPLKCGLTGKAIDNALASVEIINIRNYTSDKFKRCDDYPYGGGSGMVMKVEPLSECLNKNTSDKSFVVLTSASGIKLTQSYIREKLLQQSEICLICGHYEGVDNRIVEKYVDEEISIGDYVLSGGEYASLVIIDSVMRLLPGFMSNSESIVDESYENGLLEYPQYTRPAEYEGMRVPDVLAGGNHLEIKKWREKMSLEKTMKNRPDLYNKYLKGSRGKCNGS